MKKWYIIICCFFLIACNAQELTEKEQRILEKAQQVMLDLQEHNYEAIADEFSMFTHNSKQEIAEIIQDGWEMMSEKYGELMIVDRYQVNAMDSEYEVKIITNHENYKAQLSIVFLENEKIIGLYLK